MVGKNLELMMTLPDPPTPDAAAATLNVIGNLCGATGTGKKESGTEAGSGERPLSEGSSGSGDVGSGSGEAPRSKEAIQFETLRAVCGTTSNPTLTLPYPYPNLTLT